MFDDCGVLRICKSKSDLKNRLLKESTSRRAHSSVTATILDGSTVLWIVHWPADSASTKFSLIIKEALHINWIKPSLNQQVKHANLKLCCYLCTYANHYYELCIYTCFHIIILYSDDGSGNCRNMLVLKLSKRYYFC